MLDMAVRIASKDFIAAGKGTVGEYAGWGNVTLTREAAGFIEWKVNLPSAGKWHLFARMTAAESRPCTLIINGVRQSLPILGQVTGSWHADKLTWFAYGPYDFKEGENVLRLEFPSLIPHLKELGCAMVTPGFGAQLPWKPVPNCGSAWSITQLKDGTILSVGLDNQLYLRMTYALHTRHADEPLGASAE